MKKMLDENIKKYSIRIPIPLLDKITEIAKQSRRSLNSEIIVAIEEYVSKR